MKTATAFVGVLAWGLSTAGSASAYTINKTEGGAPTRWTAAAVVSQLDASFRNMLGPGEAEAAITMAFDAWRGYPSVPDLRVGEGEAAAPGYHRGSDTNSVYLLEDWPYEAEKLAVTVVTYELESGRMLDADILVNGETPYQLLSEQGPPVRDAYDLAAVMTHETGHVLGLGESYDDPMATMWPYAHPGDTHQRTLADDDEKAIMEAYRGIVSEAAAPGCGAASVAGPLSRRGWLGRTVWSWLPVLGVLLALRRGRYWPAAILACALLGWLSAFDRPAREHAGAAETGGAYLGSAKTSPISSDGSQATVARDAARYSGAPPVATSWIAPGASARSRAPNDPRILFEAAPDGYRGSNQGDARGQVQETSSERVSPREGPSRTVISLLSDRDRVQVGVLRRLDVDDSKGLWFTAYTMDAQDGHEVEVRLPGGTRDGVVQQVGNAPAPPDGSEIALARDPGGRPVWSYHRDGQLTGGSLEDHVLQLPN